MSNTDLYEPVVAIFDPPVADGEHYAGMIQHFGAPVRGIERDALGEPLPTPDGEEPRVVDFPKGTWRLLPGDEVHGFVRKDLLGSMGHLFREKPAAPARTRRGRRRTEIPAEPPAPDTSEPAAPETEGSQE